MSKRNEQVELTLRYSEVWLLHHLLERVRESERFEISDAERDLLGFLDIYLGDTLSEVYQEVFEVDDSK